MVRLLLRVGLATISLICLVTMPLVAAQSTASPTDSPPKFIFLLPDGFRGWVCVDFGIVGAAPLAHDGDARVISPTPGEVLATSDRMDAPILFGEAWYLVNGRRSRLPDDVTLQPGWSRTGGAEPTERSCAFIGTLDERDAAPAPPGFEKVASRGPAIPADERRALIALYQATGGDRWTHRVGWLGPSGTECNWHGVECASSHGEMTVGSLDLEENNLVGKIPNELGQLIKLQSLNLSENHLAGAIPDTLAHLEELKWLNLLGNHFSGLVPDPLIQRWLAGPLDISAEAHLLSDVSEIDFESSASAILCARQRYILRGNGTVISYAERCRKATPDDRSTYCEVKEGRIGSYEFAMLGWLTERNGFFDLAADYNRSITDATFENTRVTKSGKSHVVSNYAGAGPFDLWIIQRAIEGAASSTEWEKLSTRQKCPRW